MTDTVTLPRSVVEQALEALKYEKDANNPLDWHHDKTMHALRAALEQPQDHPEQNLDMVPEGWKLVPVEPTEDMLNAVAWPGCAATDWEHMLNAAPQPPVVEQPQGEQKPVAWMTEDGRVATDDLKRSAMASSSKASFNIPLYTHPQPKREPLNTDKWPEYPAPSVRPVYATSANTKAVRDGFEVGGYEKTPPLFTKSQLDAYALNVLRAHGIGGAA